ncbi:MAG: CoB--CoM heterodisulfide reductase iron-sulfur subunit A family protein [Chloroflexi bacterium]|nr:CoB--CoM heterodisulfide reductase iron-sulfur subunit A family protein [Chloroflexota bacterium]
MPRIGVFVCHCGSNIAATVDCAGVAEATRGFPGVVHAADFKYLCAETGQNLIRDAIAEHRLNRVVVASCSPRMHEPTFRKAVAQAGLNPYLMEMANIREHCSWVHADRQVATAKATEIIRMVVAKVARNEPLTAKQVGLTKRLLVIGGGIAGIQAALDVANAGYQVTLVERTPTIGGKMAMLDKTFPTLDCSACILTPRMVELSQHPNIELRTYAEVLSVKGFVGNFEVEILQKARKVNHLTCTGCGTCWQKCPEKNVPSEFDVGMGRRTASYIPFPQAVPNKPVSDTANCRSVRHLAAKERGEKLMECRVCEKLCPTKSIDWEQKDEIIVDRFGAIIVANGYDTFDHSVYGEYGYGKYPDVITGLQLERLMNASGPTKGEVVRPSDGKHPHSVVFLACVGSRDDKVGRPYCSKICCMYTAKHALMLKEHDPNIQTYVFYLDIRAAGRGYEEFVRRVQEEYGSTYIRGRVSWIYPQDGKLIIKGEDTLLGRPVEVEADLVVLATGITAASGAVDLMQTIGISYDTYGFINEMHPKLRPVETNTDGVYLAGCASGPKDIPDSVSQASAAAVKVCGLFSQDYLTTDPMTSVVDQMKCVGCFLCEEVCPFRAVERETLRGGKVVARINESVCKGCGLCVAACRGEALNLKGFTDQQLLAQVTALLRA